MPDLIVFKYEGRLSKEGSGSNPPICCFTEIQFPQPFLPHCLREQDKDGYIPRERGIEICLLMFYLEPS